jgi:hypothetical protein
VFVRYKDAPNAKKDDGFKAGNMKYDILQAVSADYKNFKMFTAH